MVHELTRDEARQIIVRAQLLDADRPGDVVEVAEQLGYVKIDPTSVIAPCEHHMPWSRIGWSYEQGQLSKAAYDDRLLFEFDGTYRLVSHLPAMLPAMRREPRGQRTLEWYTANRTFATEVLARLRADGPLLMQEIADTSAVQRKTDGWEGNNQVPQMLALLQRRGEVAVVRREGKQRWWDLAERVYPRDLPQLSDDEAATLRNEQRLAAAGLAKEKSPWSGVGTAGEEARVEGSKWRWRVDPEALAALDDDPGGRIAILNPYDSILFDRPRLKEAFGFEYVLEQFKKPHERVYGYFAHPILCGDRFIGLLDAKVDRSDDGGLVVNALHELVPWEPEEADMVRAELEDLATWLGVPLRGVA